MTPNLALALPAVGLLGALAATWPDARAAAPDGIAKLDPGTTALAENPRFDGIAGAPLVGDMAEAGLYTAVGLMRAGSTFPAHRHSDRRMTVVLSGTMYLGRGERIDGAALVAYPAGTVAVTEADVPHYMVARDGDFRVLEIGAGPSITTFPESGS